MSKKCWHCGREIWFKKIGPSSWVALDPPDVEMSELAFGSIPFNRRYDVVHDTTCKVQSKWNEFDKKERAVSHNTAP